MRKTKKSVIPIYGALAVWVLYCLFLPLYTTWNFVFLACSFVIAYSILSRIFPGKTEYIAVLPEPVTTGDDNVDKLLRDGETAVNEMRRLGAVIKDARVRGKTERIAAVTDKIFKNLIDDPSDYDKTRRFADYFLPETIKLLHTYDRLGSSGGGGENIAGTLRRIDSVLDTILDSYEKLYDSLFENQAIDIEIDIRVLESVLKKEGLTGKDFEI